MQKVASSFVHGCAYFLNKSLVKNLLIITLCVFMVYAQVFYPYQYYASAHRQNTGFQVGVHYVFEQDELGQITSELTRIHNLGFKIIRITLECDPADYNNIQNRKNDEFFSAAENNNLAVALVIKNLESSSKIDYYLNRWGSYLTYIQIMNEPELSSPWQIGALFTDDEIITNFNAIYTIVEAHHLQAKLYTNFGIGYVLRSNLPIELAKKLDFVGLDIFMDSFLTLSPHFVNNLQQITQKDIVITEYGISTSNDRVQSIYLTKGLTLYKNMGLTGCWLVYWNSQFDNYGIRDRPAEKAVGDWIAQNAN